jgi:hypothetical protein
MIWGFWTDKHLGELPGALLGQLQAFVMDVEINCMTTHMHGCPAPAGHTALPYFHIIANRKDLPLNVS